MSSEMTFKHAPIEADSAQTQAGQTPAAAQESDAPPSAASGLKLVLARVVFVGAFLVFWQFASGTLIAEAWVSKPTAIVARLADWIRTGFLFIHLSVTLQEMAWGLLAGSLAGIAGGFILGGNAFLGKLMDPIITAIYSLPKVALAPLFVLWFGIGLEMKIVLTATIVFFLVFWNTYAGVRETDQELIGVLRVMGARRRHLLQKVVLPGALAWIYVGLKLAIPYALIGAIVGELVASNRGLGFVLQAAAGQFDTTGMMAGLFVLMVISTIMNEVLNRSESYLMRWKVVSS